MVRTGWKAPEPRQELIWAAVDFDGTLVNSEMPDFALGEPIWRNVGKLWQLVAYDYKIIIHTARSWENYETIESWLNHYEIPFDRIVCGKLLAAIYVDDRACHADESMWLPHEGDDMKCYKCGRTPTTREESKRDSRTTIRFVCEVHRAKT